MKKLSELQELLNEQSNLFECVFCNNGHLDAIKEHLLRYHIKEDELDDCIFNYNLSYVKNFAFSDECFSYDKYQCLLYESLFHHDKEKFIEKISKLDGFIKIDQQAKYDNNSIKDFFYSCF